MILKEINREYLMDILQSEGTRQKIILDAIIRIGRRKVYIGSDDLVTIARIGQRSYADFGWSKICSYFPQADKWNFKLGAKLAILRAVGMKK